MNTLKSVVRDQRACSRGDFGQQLVQIQDRAELSRQWARVRSVRFCRSTRRYSERSQMDAATREPIKLSMERSCSP